MVKGMEFQFRIGTMKSRKTKQKFFFHVYMHTHIHMQNPQMNQMDALIPSC